MILASTLAVRSGGDVDYFAGNAKAYNASGYDEFDLTTINSNLQSFSILISFDRLIDSFPSEFLMIKDTSNRPRYYSALGSNSLNWFANADSNNSVPADGVKRVATINPPSPQDLQNSGERLRYILTYNGTTKDMHIYTQGVLNTRVATEGSPSGTFTPAYIRIGDNERLNEFGNRLIARIRRFEIINFIPTAQQIATADTAGSFRAITLPSRLLFDVDYNKTNGNAPTTTGDTPFYTNTPLGDQLYEDFGTA